MCQLGDEIRKKEGKLDSLGMNSETLNKYVRMCYKL